MATIDQTYNTTFSCIDTRTDTATGTITGDARRNTKGAPGLRFDTEVSGVAGTPTLTVSIEYQDARSGAWYNLLTGVGITANGHQVLQVDPRVPAAANLVAQQIPPTTFRAKGVLTGTVTGITWNVQCTLAS